MTIDPSPIHDRLRQRIHGTRFSTDARDGRRKRPRHDRRCAFAAGVTIVLTLAGCAGTDGAVEEPVRTTTSTTSGTTVPPSSSTTGATTEAPGEGGDGSWLLYPYAEELHVVRPDGSDPRALDIGVAGEPFAAAWSNDGEEIVFVLRGDASPTPKGAIWTASADGSGATLLYDGNGDCNEGAYWPSWSPDGSRLAMVCYTIEDGVGCSMISVLDVATMVRVDYVTLTYPDTVDNPISWSPDGLTVTFDIITWDPTDTFLAQSVVATKWVAPYGGSGPMKVLTDPALFASHPDWSPDGTRIAFNTYDTGNMHGIDHPSNVYTIAPDGTDLRQLSTASIDGKMRLGQPFWSSDGSRIWVSLARDWETDSNGLFKNTLAWVDASTGEFHEIGTEGKRFRERPNM